MEGSSSSNKPKKSRFAKMPSFKFSRQQSNLSTGSSNNPIDDALEKVGKKIKNWMLKSKEKVKEVGKEMGEVVHRGEHKHKYDEISEKLQKYADSEGNLNFEYRKLVETKNEIKNKYGEDLKNAQDSVKDFLNFIRLIEIIVAKPENFKKKIIGQIKAHFLIDNEKVEEKYIKLIKKMIEKYKNYQTEKNDKIAGKRKDYIALCSNLLETNGKLKSKMSSDGFDKDKVKIDKEIQRLNEEFGKYNKAYDCGLNLIKKKTGDSPSHKGSHRRGSREFSIGSNEEIRSNMSGELSVYSQNSNESGNSSDRSTSSASRLLKGVASTAKKTHLFAKGIPAKQIKRNLGFCEEMIKPLYEKINLEIDEIKEFFEDIRKALYDFKIIYKQDFSKYNQIFSTGEADNSGALQSALALLREKETIIYLIDLFRMKQTSNFFIGELYKKCRNSAINSLDKEGKFNENKQTVTTIKELLMVLILNKFI